MRQRRHSSQNIRNILIHMDGGRLAIAIVLEEEESDMICLVTDLQAALGTSFNLAWGQAPPTHVKRRIMVALTDSRRGMGALWARAHIGIPDNEKADKQPGFGFIFGSLRGSNRLAREDRVQTMSKQVSRAVRRQLSFNRE